MVEPHHIHWIAAKNLLRYLCGTTNYLVENLRLHGYTNVDYTSSVVNRKSTYGFWFSLRSASISWISRKQKSVALSIAEAENIAARMACSEVVWLTKLFSELFEHMLDNTVIFCDNQSGIHLSKNLVFHNHSKHIDIRYHFIWNMVQQGAIRLQHIRTDEQVTNILTKPLGKVKFLSFRERFGVVEMLRNLGHHVLGDFSSISNFLWVLFTSLD